ncbi:hypothetical protein JG688_00007596, partial [Phytophthora aleatoria]
LAGTQCQQARSKRATPEVLLAQSCRRSNGLWYPDSADRVEKVPLRQTQCSLSEAVEVSCTTIQRYLTTGYLRRQFSSVKPRLTDAHKKCRFEIALQHALTFDVSVDGSDAMDDEDMNNNYLVGKAPASWTETQGTPEDVVFVYAVETRYK